MPEEFFVYGRDYQRSRLYFAAIQDGVCAICGTNPSGERDARDREILTAHQAGEETRWIADRFGLTVSQTNRIIGKAA